MGLCLYMFQACLSVHFGHHLTLKNQSVFNLTKLEIATVSTAHTPINKTGLNNSARQKSFLQGPIKDHFVEKKTKKNTLLKNKTN